MKRRQEAAEAAEREKREREAAEAAAKLAAEQDTVDRAVDAQAQAQGNILTSGPMADITKLAAAGRSRCDFERDKITTFSIVLMFCLCRALPVVARSPLVSYSQSYKCYKNRSFFYE